MDDRRPAQAGAQNPAYRPTHPFTWLELGCGATRHHSGHTRQCSPESVVERVAGSEYGAHYICPMTKQDVLTGGHGVVPAACRLTGRGQGIAVTCRQSLLPLTSAQAGGRMVGYLLLSNRSRARVAVAADRSGVAVSRARGFTKLNPPSSTN